VQPAEPQPVVALFDMDGTLVDYWGELCRQLALLRSPEEPNADPASFNWEQTPDHLRERMRLIKNSPGFWLNLPVWSAGFEVMEEAQRLSMQIEVLTKGPRQAPIAWMEKLQWCDRHLAGFPHHVTITMDKGLVYGRLLVDDYPDYIQRWLRWRNRGQVILPDQPWNQGFAHPQVYRYTGNRAEMAAVLVRVVADARSAPAQS